MRKGFLNTYDIVLYGGGEVNSGMFHHGPYRCRQCPWILY